MSGEEHERGGVTRLGFIKSSAGVAAGVAAVGVPVAVSRETAAVVAKPSATPREPVLAYVRHAGRGEVTVMSGTSEVTYRDPALVRRLLGAAPRPSASEGGIDVVAP